jgi:predicted RNA binding protein YcfA (HicA-like mRNA interferase family)
VKRRDFLRHLDSTGCVLEREGGKHSIYLNLANQKTSAVPRHKEIYPPLPKKSVRISAFNLLRENSPNPKSQRSPPSLTPKPLIPSFFSLSAFRISLSAFQTFPP